MSTVNMCSYGESVVGGITESIVYGYSVCVNE